jgi:hypothetical protein
MLDTGKRAVNLTLNESLVAQATAKPWRMYWMNYTRVLGAEKPNAR